MNKSFLFLLLIQLISDMYTNIDRSPCLDASLLTRKNLKRNFKYKLTEDYCRNKVTTDATNLICLLSENNKYCEEYPKSDCITRFLDIYSNGKLNKEDCLGLETSSNDYICALNKERNRCIEKFKRLRALDDDDDDDSGDDDDWGDDDDDAWDEDDYYEPSECEESIQNRHRKYNLTQEFCRKLETYSSRYKCILSTDKHYCIEVSINYISGLKLFILPLSLLLLF